MEEALTGVLFALWFIATYLLTAQGARELKQTRAYWLCLPPRRVESQITSLPVNKSDE